MDKKFCIGFEYDIFDYDITKGIKLRKHEMGEFYVYEKSLESALLKGRRFLIKHLRRKEPYYVTAFSCEECKNYD